jgi:hypothetical protein
LNLEFLKQISLISFVDIDDVMINGYGYNKIEEEERAITYVKFKKEDLSDIIIIQIFDSKDDSRNIMDIKVGPSFSMRKIKDDLVDDGFLYGGLNDIGFYIYRKEDIVYLISEEPNESGAHQILRAYSKKD